MKLSTSFASDCDWRLRSAAACSTCEDAEPASSEARLTPVMFWLTSSVPVAACWALLDISWVAADCSSTSAAIAEVIWLMWSMVWLRGE